MKVMRLHAINDFRLEEIETPSPKGDEILVKIGACGICGSDIPRVYQLGTRVYPRHPHVPAFRYLYCSSFHFFHSIQRKASRIVVLSELLFSL